jgi:ribonuclease P protein component
LCEGKKKRRLTIETNISTEQNQTQKNSRIYATYEHSCGTSGFKTPSRQRQKTSNRLIDFGSFYRLVFNSLEKLKKTEQFQKVYAGGKKYYAPFLQVFILRTSQECSRFGVTATKRLGDAVRRNRAKRLIRESMRLLSPAIANGTDIVILAKPEILKLKEPSVREQLSRIFKKAQIFKIEDRTGSGINLC